MCTKRCQESKSKVCKCSCNGRFHGKGIFFHEVSTMAVVCSPVLALWEKMKNRKLNAKLYCGVCQDLIEKAKVWIWTEDDSIHFLCPGCNNDLLSPLMLSDLYEHIEDLPF